MIDGRLVRKLVSIQLIFLPLLHCDFCLTVQAIALSEEVLKCRKKCIYICVNVSLLYFGRCITHEDFCSS